MFPKDFAANGLHCGIAKKKIKKDIALFYSKRPALAAGMFTSNLVKAAPVIVSQKHLDTSEYVRAIVANSGCANACTGDPGLRDAKEECYIAAEALKVKPAEILVASSGVIGQFPSMPKVKNGIRRLAQDMNKDIVQEENAVRAIMTTDTFPKIASTSVLINGTKITVWGCVKGAGMIHPSLVPHATMLSFILTDAVVTRSALKKSLQAAAEVSFNCVSVDGDTSTNDTVFLVANGAAENACIKDFGKAYNAFAQAVSSVCRDLARMIARDGEGATRLIEIRVANAANGAAAKKIAATVATSPLVKTAFFGCDANWGRILAACGRAGVPMNPETVDIYLGDICVCRHGMANRFSEAKARKLLEKKEVVVTIDLGQGKARGVYYTCDFSFDYVKINADYRT
jgi:glutamate N-acetyltransferase/amino-acid N-acetyltransferase